MQSPRFRLPLLFAITFSAALIACSAPVRPTPPPFVLPTQVFVPPPTASAQGTPAAPPSPQAPQARATAPSAPATPSAASTLAAGITRVKIFLVALNDNGKSGKKIGCDDSIIGVDRVISLTQAPLTAALNELFSIRDRSYGQSGLYNALYQSSLTVDSITLTDSKATIHLSGKFMLGGVCDNPRFKEQIEETALQFSTVKQVEVFVNGIPIDKLLSEK
jgi:hypothetical protein